MSNYPEYIKNTKEDIAECLTAMGCQPILFIGSGFSIRHFDAPSWESLLQKLIDLCPEVEKEFAYYKQSLPSLEAVGSKLAQFYREWAWNEGKVAYPPKLFAENIPGDIYIKHTISTMLDKITPKSIKSLTNGYAKEIPRIQAISPHAVITTNYDKFLELIFPEYEPVIGQRILRSSAQNIGEIFKIHGCISNPRSLVLTQEDYEDFIAKKKYLSAKLLTFFSEHPLLFIGYSVNDRNIRGILSDIDEILAAGENTVPNIYFLQWSPDVEQRGSTKYEEPIPISNGKHLRVKCIEASDFSWVYESFGQFGPIEKIKPKLLRALLARTYKLVRADIPRGVVDVNYETLEEGLKDPTKLTVLGINPMDDPSNVNAQFPLSLTLVAEKLGFKHWYHANELLKKISEDKGVDLKKSDNQYHLAIPWGKSGNIQHKYSRKILPLLKAVRDGNDYTVVF